MKSKILVCTHGGIGNQLFQILYARLVAARITDADIYYVHNNTYKRKACFELSRLSNLNRASFLIKTILFFRIPKVLERLNFSKKGFISFFNVYILDNYFQNPKQYSRFTKNEIIFQIEKLRLELLNPSFDIKLEDSVKESIFHFRLGDFFNSENQEMDFIKTQLSSIPDRSLVISNKDELFKNFDNPPWINKDLKYFNTENYNSLELLNLFSSFPKIYSNGSTLAFWGAVLSKSKYIFTGQETEYSVNLKKLLNIFNH